jgi:hypothetical protein
MTKEEKQKQEKLIEAISNCISFEYVDVMKKIFAEICSDPRLLAAVWANDLLDQGDQCAIARQAMESAIEIACDDASSVYDNLPEVEDVWTWE